MMNLTEIRKLDQVDSDFEFIALTAEEASIATFDCVSAEEFDKPGFYEIDYGSHGEVEGVQRYSTFKGIPSLDDLVKDHQSWNEDDTVEEIREFLEEWYSVFSNEDGTLSWSDNEETSVQWILVG